MNNLGMRPHSSQSSAQEMPPLLTHHLCLPSVGDKEIESLILFLVAFSELQVGEGAGRT